jgi:DNA-binding NarL/FixJ family response regulator
MTTVLLVDDEPQVLDGLEMLLATIPELQIAGRAVTGEAALALARKQRPDIIVMDVRLPGTDGILATRRLASELPESAIVILSLYGDPETRRQARQAGAHAFVAKHDMGGELLATIQQLMTRQSVLSDEGTT